MDMNKHNLFISSSKKNVFLCVKAMMVFVLILTFCLKVAMPQYLNLYNASLIDKVNRLNSLDEPKIVLLGNSNVAFGIESQLIEDAFSMPVVNMGLHGGLGNAFHEQMARLNVCRGDIYIICHSNFSDNSEITDAVLAWTTIENHLELWRILRVQDIYPMIKAYPTYLKNCLELLVAGEGNQLTEGCYSRNAFNEYGDVCFERMLTKYTFENVINPPKINKTAINRINELNHWLNERDAILLVAGYPIGKGNLTAPDEEFVKIQKELEEKLECPFISEYKDYMFDYDLFYDSDLHLTTQGAQIRTNQLISDLKQWKEDK
ncbi:hypothetical protein D7X87_17890 [bacterium D16-54]|nr:hypothetical protein D7X87_17890 [bacterium D16-54]RKJ12698.1 hypothetical protein D7X65_18335 [bacterium D16-56]